MALLQVGSDGFHGAGYITEVGFVILVERRGHTDDDDVHLGNQAVIGGGDKAALLGRLNLSSGNANDVRTTPIQRSHFAGINVEPSNGKALLAEQQRQRQAHIPHTNNADAGLAGFDLMLDFCCRVE